MSIIMTSFAEKLDSFIKPYVPNVCPSLAIVVYHRGQKAADSAWGWIDPETNQIPITPETLFDFASLTKLFTTTAFLSLVTDGRVNLETPLVDVLPEFGAISPRPIDGGQDPHSKQRLPTPPELVGQSVDPSRVTFFHLLTHTSGLPPWRDVFNAAGDAPLPPTETDPISRDVRWSRAVKALCEYPFVGHPGETVRYSDIGLMILGEAASRLHGTSGGLEQVLKARVFEPLALEDIMFNPMQKGLSLTSTTPTENDPTWRKRRVWGEVHDENACGVGGVAGHAGLFGTARTVAKFAQIWLSGNVAGVDSALVDQATRQQAETDGERRGLGWMIRSLQGSSAGDFYSANTYGHTGFVGNSLWIDPEQQLITVCMSNNVYWGRQKEGIIAFRRALHDFVWKECCL
jgi:CubicO group peptidase (beta-lactamase class C family)